MQNFGRASPELHARPGGEGRADARGRQSAAGREVSRLNFKLLISTGQEAPLRAGYPEAKVLVFDLATRRVPRRKARRVSEPHAANPSVSGGEARRGRDAWRGSFPSYPITGQRRHLPGLRGIELRLPRLHFSSVSDRARGTWGRGGSVRAAPAKPLHGVPQSSSHSPSETGFILFLISVFLCKQDPSMAPRLLYSPSSSPRTQGH